MSFFGGGWGSNPRPCIFYALSIPTELNSRGHIKWVWNNFYYFLVNFLKKNHFYKYKEKSIFLNLKQNFSKSASIHKSSDICTSNWWQFWWQPCFSLFLLVKNNGERKRKRENKNVMWVRERKLSKSCHIMVVQIWFLHS